MLHAWVKNIWKCMPNKYAKKQGDSCEKNKIINKRKEREEGEMREKGESNNGKDEREKEEREDRMSEAT